MFLSVDGSSKPDYSFGERLLHRMALGLPWVGRMSFNLDGLFSSKSRQFKDNNNVFICGLARSGTTILMRAFYQTGLFRSLTYRDMPFVLMPSIWQQVVKLTYKEGRLHQRAHGDGIFVDYDSPEAFEEVFWLTFCKRNYILGDRLVPHVADTEVIRQFRQYVGRIVTSGRNTGRDLYLSKNNNNILRLSTIRAAFPQSLIIIPFRDPLQQAASLLSQHQNFCDSHRKNKFSREYMQWLGHHEFGLTHKPFCFERNIDNVITTYEPDNINYWVTLWINTYRYLIDKEEPKSIFVCYETLCDQPKVTLSGMLDIAGLPTECDIQSLEIALPPDKIVRDVDQSLINKAAGIYDSLCQQTNLS